ncbi:predicted protein [Naegleria gruberi]|uniref:Predicted protein n=1 Tax=Naegleria gruberi TaxID=5762 RepID=D2VSZ2_NAEGR|nr:uncharacterized protein NAEGRDRAFT_72113 [Naegleria gruberi]EFC39987.1 predicted protein [Naegleria gruberi]|eukprot:XP_002672731.1 predicted protein [Naegleria gruberi strain NEG-M]
MVKLWYFLTVLLSILILVSHSCQAKVIDPNSLNAAVATHLYERKFLGALCDGTTGLACYTGYVKQTFLYNETELYFTNSFTKSINKYNLQTKVVETIVGTGSYHRAPLTLSDLYATPKETNIGEPNSVAVYQGFVYFTTIENTDVIFRVKSEGSGLVTIFAGVSGSTGYNPLVISRTSSPLSGPTYLNFYSNGNLILYESEICTIRLISGNNITTLAGNGLCNYAYVNNTLSNGISAMTISTDQILYISTPSGVIMKWNGADFVTVYDTQAFVSSLAANSANIYFTTDTNELSSVSIDGSNRVVLMGPNLGFMSDGQVLSGGKTASPMALSISKASSTLFFSENGNARIRTYLNANVKTLIGFSSSGSAATTLVNPTKMALVGSNLYVLETMSGSILNYDVSGNAPAGGGGYKLVTSIAGCSSIVAINNTVYVGSTLYNSVYKIEGTKAIRIAGNGTNLSSGDGKYANASTISNPLALASDSSGSLYILSTNIIRKVDKNGIISTLYNYFSTGLNDIYISEKDEILISDLKGYVYQLTCTTDLFQFCGYIQIAGVSNGLARSVGFNNALEVPIKPLTISAVSNFKTGYWNTLLISESTSISVVSEGLISGLVYNPKNSPTVSFQTLQVTGFAVNQTNGVIYVSGPYGISTLTPYKLPREACPCSGNGICYSNNPNLCLCDQGWSGTKCALPLCNGILSTNPQVCTNGQGVCSAPDSCVCKSGFVGTQCQIPFCVGSTLNENFTCSESQSNSGSNSSTSTKQEIIVEVVETVTDLNSKNLTFTTVDTIEVVFPSNFSSYLSQTISQIANNPITLVSSVVDSTNSSTNPSENPVKPQLVVSPVITLSLFTNSSMIISVKNLEKPIELLFTNIQLSKIESSSNLTCMFFDTSINDWSDEGISSKIISIQQADSQFVISMKCETKHLTSFAVIDKNYKKQVSSPNEGGNKIPATVSEWKSQLEGLSESEIIAISVSIGGSCLIIATLAILISVVCIIVMKRKKNRCLTI